MNYQGYYHPSMPPPPSGENVNYSNYPPDSYHHQRPSMPSSANPNYAHYQQQQSMQQPLPNNTNYSGYNPNFPQNNMTVPSYSPMTTAYSNNMMNYPPRYSSTAYPTENNTTNYGSFPSMPSSEDSNNIAYNSSSYVPQSSSTSNKRSHKPENYNTGRKNSDSREHNIVEPEMNKRKRYDVDSNAPSSTSNISSNGKDTILLNNGKSIPTIQFGTYKMKGPDCKKAVLSAFRAGYKGLDTASVYDNEKEVGEAIVESGIPRENLFIQTKLWRSFCGRGKNGKPKCDPELNKSLRKLGTKYIDCWLMHWPGPGRHLNYPPVRQGMDRPKVKIEGNASKMVPEDWTPAMRLDTYKEMAKHVGSSVRSLGVCNFSVRQLEDLLVFCKENNIPKPAVVQNECHPLLTAADVRKFCSQEGIVFQAYASLGAGSLGLMDNTVVKQIAARHGVTPAQVLLKWGLQLGCALLPKFANVERQKTNLDIWSFKLSEEDMLKLNSCDKSVKGQNTMAGWLREHDPDFY